MAINAHVYVKRLLDVRHRSVYIEQCPIGMHASDCHAVGFGKSNKRQIILFARSKLFSELIRLEIPMIKGTEGIVNLLKQIGQDDAVPQWQSNSKVEARRGCQALDRSRASHGWKQVSGHDLF